MFKAMIFCSVFSWNSCFFVISRQIIGETVAMPRKVAEYNTNSFLLDGLLNPFLIRPLSPYFDIGLPRRDKATSNICTAQALLANMAASYGVYHGPKGVKEIAERIHGMAAVTAEALKGAGYSVPTETFFDTFIGEGLLEDGRGMLLRSLTRRGVTLYVTPF